MGLDGGGGPGWNLCSAMKLISLPCELQCMGTIDREVCKSTYYQRMAPEYIHITLTRDSEPIINKTWPAQSYLPNVNLEVSLFQPNEN